MIRIPSAILLIAIFSMMIGFSCGEEVVNLNTDEVVLKALSREPQKKGSLTELSTKNKITLEKEQSVEKTLIELGINPEKIEIIEGYTLMRWSVKRVRVSPSYELLIQLGMGSSGEDLVIGMAVIPHRLDKLRHKLSNQKNWDTVIFE